MFSNRSVPLDQVWGREEDTLRSRLREIDKPPERLQSLEDWLAAHLIPRIERQRFSLHPAVDFALRQFGRNSNPPAVAEMARASGWSERHLSQIFREQVGFAPKVWWRIQRFQRALRLLRAGLEIPLAEVAAECGFYDQSHFANEFRSFSGITVGAYNATRHQLWTNHSRMH